MAWFLFLDESGHDRRASPYEVLAGVAVEDRDLWNLILAMHEAEVACFGTRISPDSAELKGRKLLKRKTYRLAAQSEPIEPHRRRMLAESCLAKSRAVKGTQRDPAVTREELTALGQAKLAFVDLLLELAARHGARAFASIVDPDSPRPAGDFLRKDYAYLFERFYYFLDERGEQPQGVVVFDELERSQCHLLVGQMAHYFRRTRVGRRRAARVVPEPFFVHSDLTTLIQLADIVAYVISWGVRLGSMQRPHRPELGELADAVSHLRYRATRDRLGNPFHVWSFALIDDLRPREEREGSP